MLMGRISATVLFVQDLDKCAMFYRDTLGLPVSFSDDVSIGFRIEDQDFLLLKVSAAAKMISEEALSAGQEAGHRVLLCVAVENVDTTHEALTAKGIEFIKPPVSQAWGRRTAYFADPEGNLWELWHPLALEPQK